MRAPVAVLASACNRNATPLGFRERSRVSAVIRGICCAVYQKTLYLSSDCAAFDALFRECVKFRASNSTVIGEGA